MVDDTRKTFSIFKYTCNRCDKYNMVVLYRFPLFSKVCHLHAVFPVELLLEWQAQNSLTNHRVVTFSQMYGVKILYIVDL